MNQFRKLKSLALMISMMLGTVSVAIAQMSHHNDHKMDHSMSQSSHHAMMGHDMSKMQCDMSQSKGSASSAQHCMGGLEETIAIPSGQPLNELPLLKNESQQAGVFQITLKPTTIDVALAKGTKTNLWLYNKTLLPVIDVNVGDKVSITLDNDLPEPTVIHWHGLSVPPDQDGNPQDAIQPGEKKTYQFTITPDMVGTHWFHPHTHNLTAEQVYKGLAGAFIVRDPQDPLRHLPEQNLFFSDLKLDKAGQVAPNSMMDKMNGREGQYALLNGQNKPVIQLDSTERWRLWNGNSGRYLQLSFPEDKVEAFLVGTDGGLIESPQKITTLLLTPGERAEVVVTPKDHGEFPLVALAYDRHKMGPVQPEQDRILATVKTTDTIHHTIPKKLREIPAPGKPTVKHQLVYTEENHMDFLINGKKHDLNRIDWETEVGRIEEWEIVNDSHMDHNFHLHGTQFQIKEFELNGQVSKPAFKMLKDTVNLKPGEKIRIITQQNSAGIRMFHCHILEHEDLGMMGQILVK